GTALMAGAGMALLTGTQLKSPWWEVLLIAFLVGFCVMFIFRFVSYYIAFKAANNTDKQN
ncbi:MAG: hypothetical protein ACOX6J_07265, partial [Oscillospiraceae bacterium]